ncbi:MAG: RdgB/HAM1 family non-canonical purine NTP pyrophosphatase [Chlamydiia bacterium]|nr:RdgB/HAM1 family non-canonical purine NTP pyrophosphatase [Chlamydiia bacterium]
MEILVATTNQGKVRELRTLLAPLGHIHLLTLRDFPDFSPLEEIGDSLEQIAADKALYAADQTGLWTLADDSGLFVPALGNQPGVRSARYAGETASDLENRRKLLKEMEKLDGDARAAYFECALAFAKPGLVLKVVTGRCEGSVLTEERGSNGFGYDPLFLKDSYDKTFAELSPDIKNKVSHRWKALEKMAI